MRLIQRHSILAAALAVIATTCQTANAQFAPGGSGGKRATNAASDVKFITKVYRVDDLILPSPNYPFRGTWLPEMTHARNETSGGGSFHKRAKSGGVMGGMGGMMGGGGMPGGMGRAGSGGEESMMAMGGMMAGMMPGAGPGGGDGGAVDATRKRGDHAENPGVPPRCPRPR